MQDAATERVTAYAYSPPETDPPADAEAAAHERLVLARSTGDVAQSAASTTALAIAGLDAYRPEESGAVVQTSAIADEASVSSSSSETLGGRPTQ